MLAYTDMELLLGIYQGETESCTHTSLTCMPSLYMHVCVSPYTLYLYIYIFTYLCITTSTNPDLWFLFSFIMVYYKLSLS